MLAQRLHQAVAAVAPVVGVSIGEETEKDTWQIDFAPEATEQQRAAAEAVIAELDPTAPVAEAPSLEQRVAAIESALAEAKATTEALLAKGVLTPAEISAVAAKPGN
jgi:hypothetical protein